jgi:hypothetical protein
MIQDWHMAIEILTLARQVELVAIWQSCSQILGALLFHAPVLNTNTYFKLELLQALELITGNDSSRILRKAFQPSSVHLYSGRWSIQKSTNDSVYT